MKILFLAHNFPPESSPLANRTYEHAKHWVKMGHQVEVVTDAPNHPTGKLYPGYRNAWFQREVMDGIDVVRVWTMLAANKGFVRRSLGFVSYFLSASAQAMRLARPDVVVSSSPQLFAGLSGYPISRLRRTPWVLEIRDLWPESIVAVGAMQRGSMLSALEAVERFAYRKSNHIVPVSEAFRAHIEATGIAARKITIITNAADLDLFSTPVRNEALASELGLAGKFVAAYCGTHGMAHALGTLLEAADRLRSRPDIRILMVGGGAEQAALRERRDTMELGNVIMLDQQRRERMPEIWGLANVGIVHLRDTPLFRTVIPSKMFEIMAAGLPVVLGVEGEAAGILADAQAGLTVKPEDADDLAGAIARLADDPGFARSLGANGRRVVKERYDRRVAAERYAAILEDVVQAAGRKSS